MDSKRSMRACGYLALGLPIAMVTTTGVARAAQLLGDLEGGRWLDRATLGLLALWLTSLVVLLLLVAAQLASEPQQADSLPLPAPESFEDEESSLD